MGMRTNGPGAGWGWLVRGINTGRNNPKSIFGAAVLLLLCALLPSAVQVAVQLVAKPGSNGIMAMVGAMTLVAAVLYPLLFGGFMRVIDASENQRQASAWTVFEPFRTGQGGGRLVGFGIGLMLVYVAFLAVLFVTVGHDLLLWYLRLLTMGAAGTAAGGKAALPHGFGASIGLTVAFGVVFNGMYAIGLGQVALRRRSPLSALRDGFAGALRNLLPLLVLAISSVLAIVLLVVVFLLLGVLLALLAGLLSKALVPIVLVPLYLTLLMVIYVVMFGVMYAIWRDVAGDGAETGTAPAGLEA